MIRLYFFVLSGVLALSAGAQEIFRKPPGVQSRLSSFENPQAGKGVGGQTNKGAKGNAFEWIQPGETKTLLNESGSGIIQRIWLTIDQNPVKLRSLRLQMFWDGERKPAVDVPMGDFFVYNLGRQVAFQSHFFSSGEGRSFNCYIPMPFRKGARIVLVNEGREGVKLFYDVSFIERKPEPGDLYFHAYWSRQTTGKLGDDFVVLPKVSGSGRFLGMSVGLNTDSVYGKTWWGEGEVKMYLDGDRQWPTIVGTGAEDYIGSAWGLGTFTHLYQGCTVASDSLRQYNFYRWHVPDAIYFNTDLKVTLQQVGGGTMEIVRDLFKKGVRLQPISIDRPAGFVRLLDSQPPLQITDANFTEGWVNFYRVDDYSAVSYFYLDKPSSGLPALPGVEVRTKGVK